jgi:hypothetical protein
MGRGSGDLVAFVFWTIPLAVALGFAGAAFVHFFRIRFPSKRFFLLICLAVLLSLTWFYVVYYLLGPWFYGFSIPIFYLWTIGCFVQLVFLDRRLPLQKEETSFSKLILSILIMIGIGAGVLNYMYVIFKLYARMQLEDQQKLIYLFPKGMTGDFRVVYGEKCGVMPDIENGKKVMKLPADGILIVQSAYKGSWGENEYFSVDQNGMREKMEVGSGLYERNQKSPAVIQEEPGHYDGIMPDGSYSDESLYSINYQCFTVYKDSIEMNGKQNSHIENILDSLTRVAVWDCRKTTNLKTK